MKFAIYPPIGIARVGNSESLFLGPERIGSAGTELPEANAECQNFKDSTFRVRPQACRFHLVQTDDDGGSPRLFVPDENTLVKWSVRLANKKDAILRPPTPPSSPVMPVNVAGRQDRLIDSGIVSIVGASAPPIALQGRYLTTVVELGGMQTDEDSRLILTGGKGISFSPENAPLGNEGLAAPRRDSFYNNAGWFDDVSDGPVRADIELSSGEVVVADTAWLIVGPPDIARTSLPVTSLYDVMKELAIERGWLPADTTTSFAKDIFPMLFNARSLRWTHLDVNVAGSPNPTPEPNWAAMSADYVSLADTGTSVAQIAVRKSEAGKVRKIEKFLRLYEMRKSQIDHLDRWVTGNFINDWTGSPPFESTISPDGLIRSALQACAGQGFFPGIEAGRIVTLPDIYLQPFRFRFDSNKLVAGDITALMAQPWTADFLECLNNWWPSQRADLAPQGDGSFDYWHRPFLDTDNDHRQLAKNVMRLGIVKRSVDAAGVEGAVEEGRDPAL